MFDHRRVRVTGPLAALGDGVWNALLALGYAPLSARNLFRVMANLSRWMARRALDPVELNPGRIQQFVRYRRRVGFVSWRSSRGLAPVIDYLREAGAIPPSATPAKPSPAEKVVQGYGTYLEEERRCTGRVVEGNQRAAGGFLAWRFGRERPRLDRLTGEDVTRFMLRDARSRSVGSAQNAAVALRSFLRYVHAIGLHDQDLSAAVPSPRRPRFARLPKDLQPDEVRRLLRTPDVRTSVGRRNRALLLLLVRLGLRRSEVVGLRLQDLDWRAGELLVRGKGGRSDRLPLPHDVGEALASYLRRGRPRRDSRQVFLQVRAPYRDLTPGALTTLVGCLGVQAGTAHVSPHRLRHTAATQMLRKGASLQDIAQVLRHRHLGSTAIYARVDDAALRPLARCWPEVVR